jgi:hypothetical protein
MEAVDYIFVRSNEITQAEALIFWPARYLVNTTDSSALPYLWSLFLRSQLFKGVFIKHVEPLENCIG